MFRRCTMVLGVASLVFAITGSVKAELLADSVSDFSGTQGANSWYYGYYAGALTPATFTLFPTFDPNFATNEGNSYDGGPGGWYLQWGPGGYWTSLWPNGGHPNGTDGNQGRAPVEQWAVRRWVSDVSGEITISGLMASLNGSPMMVSVLVDGDLVFSQQIPSSETSYNFCSRSRGEKLILEDRNGSAIKEAWQELSLRESRLTR